LRRLQKEAIDGVQLTVRFKHFPLPMHVRAPLAHQAAEAAGAQGKFWEMHDLLFANRSMAQRSDLLGYARRLGLDMTRFERDLDSDRTKQVIAADVDEGIHLHVTGTPTFTINGARYSGARSFDQLKDLIAGRQPAATLPPVADARTSKGPSNAPVTLELFLDLESPVSLGALEVVDHILKQYPTAVRLHFRNFPLAFHPEAILVHEAAMTAARGGHFWEFANLVLARECSPGEPSLIACARRLGFDEDQFADAIHRHRDRARVERDLQAGLARGFRGSPVILVNDQRIDGVPSAQMLTEYVEAALKRDTSSVARRLRQ
jgi:protein-disulfide isomerase